MKFTTELGCQMSVTAADPTSFAQGIYLHLDMVEGDPRHAEVYLTQSDQSQLQDLLSEYEGNRLAYFPASDDPELQAIEVIRMVLETLESKAQSRVLQYVENWQAGDSE
jgi:hypothetical protein